MRSTREKYIASEKERSKRFHLWSEQNCQYIFTATVTNVSGSTVDLALQKNGLTGKKISTLLSKGVLSTGVNSWQKFSNTVDQEIFALKKNSREKFSR